MACACKNKSNGQVTAVKQVVRKAVPTNNRVNAPRQIIKRSIVKQTVYRRPI